MHHRLAAQAAHGQAADQRPHPEHREHLAVERRALAERVPDEDRQADVDRAVQEVEDERHPDQPQDESRDRAEDGEPRALRFSAF